MLRINFDLSFSSLRWFVNDGPELFSVRSAPQEMIGHGIRGISNNNCIKHCLVDICGDIAGDCLPICIWTSGPVRLEKALFQLFLRIIEILEIDEALQF